MLVRQSLSPRRKCQTPSMWESRQAQQFKKQTYLKTEELDTRVVQSRNDDQKRKVQSIVQKKTRSMSHQKPQLNSSTTRTTKVPTRKSSLQRQPAFLNQSRIHPHSTTHESQHFEQQTLKEVQQLIEGRQFDRALEELQTLDPFRNQNDIAYMKGVIYMNKQDFQSAIQEFAKHRDLNGQIALLMAVAYKKSGQLQEAISILKDFLKKKQQPMLYDALIYRAKLLVKAKKFSHAMQDFYQASILEEEITQQLGTLGRADVLRLSGKLHDALIIYESMAQNSQIFMRRINCLIDLHQYQNALNLLAQVPDQHSSEIYQIRGSIQLGLGQVNESLLSYEQCIKENNSRKAVTKSLQEIAKIKIDQRDFYAAYYTLQRADHLDVDKEALHKLRIFTEGVIFLMKRKYQDGVNNLTQLINNFQLGEFIKKSIFAYRAYGFICLQKYPKALNDLIYLQNFQELEQTSLYNKYICEGIVMASQSQFERAISQFQKASKLYPGKMEPHFYKSMTIMQFVQKHQPQDKDKYIKNALKHLDKAVTLSDNNNLLYHRGVLRFYFGLIDEALQDLNKAAEKSEENNPKYYYARGLVRACLKNNKQALHDFSLVINIDTKFAEAYLNRAKIFQLLGDKNLAFNDLQAYIQLKPQDPEIHLWAGNLLFNIGSHEHAIKTYSHSNEIQTSVQLLTYRAQCYIIMKELNAAMQDLQKIIELTGDKKSYVDKESLLALKTAAMGPDDIPQKLKHSSKPANYRVASQMLKKLLLLNFDGHVFKLSDLHFYRGVMKFYMKNYHKAVESWTQSYTMKQQIDSSETESYASFTSPRELPINEMEELEFEDRTYNMYEYYYNVSMATLLQGEKAKARDLLNQLAQSLQDTYESQIEAFISELDNNRPQSIYLFPFSNRLCCIFPTFIVGQAIETRLSFCLPRIVPPSMKPEFDRKLIENLQPTVVDNKPEAPWIRRNQEGVVFTDDVQQVDLDLRSESQRSAIEENVSVNDDIVITDQQEEQEDVQTVAYNQRDFERLRMQLQLDKTVEYKLARLK